MTDLAPLTALGTPLPQSARLGALTFREEPGQALASLALPALAQRRGAAPPSPFGLRLPGPGGWTSGGGIAALWTGPGQWLIEGPGQAEADFAAALAAQAPGCAVTDQTDGFVLFEITSEAGPAPILRLLEKLVNLDPACLGPGAAHRTGFDHQSILLIRRADDRLAVLGLRSAAGSLWHGLNRIAQRLALPAP